VKVRAISQSTRAEWDSFERVHQIYVLDANSRAGSVPGSLKPVSIFGLFAKVLPGTRLELEMMPVTDSVWMVSRFAVDTRVSILGRKSVKTTESTFSNYEPAAAPFERAVKAAP
jgi:N-acyl-L-homoserine lactone synthetase